MRKFLGVILVGVLAAYGTGCGSDSSSGAGGSGGSGGSGGTAGTGGSGGPCSAEDPLAIIINDPITEDTTWDRTDCDYILPEGVIVYVENGATLTIEPGITVKGDAMSALVVTRGSSIDAQGTVDEPIVMTSSRAEGARLAGDWGGLALLGEGVLNRGVGTCGGDTGMVCQDNLEGLPATDPRSLFGGDDNASSCGTLNYVRIEFAGNEISPNNELNGLTLGGCGSGTQLDFIQVHRGLDDGVEFFGGAANINHVIVDGMGDDGLDWDQGYVGEIKGFISHHFAGSSDDPRGIEADNAGGNTNLEPRSAPTVSYGTVVANVGTSHDQGIVLRRGTWGVLTGVVVANYDTAAGIDVRDDGWAAMGGWPTGLNVTMSCFDGNDPNYPTDVDCESDGEGGSTGASDCNDWNQTGDVEDEANYFPEITDVPAAGNLEEDPMLGDYERAIDGETPDYSVGNGNCMGAFAEDGEDWTEGWTAFPID